MRWERSPHSHTSIANSGCDPMPYGSVIANVIAKYGTLTASNFPDSSRPDIWLDEAPQEDGSGAQEKVPYAIIEDHGGDPKWTFPGGTQNGQNAIVTGGFTISVWYPSTELRDGLGDADQAIAAILWNGAVPAANSGIAFMTLDLASPLKGMSVVPSKDQRKYAGFSFQGKPVYTVRQEFKTQVALGAAGY